MNNLTDLQVEKSIEKLYENAKHQEMHRKEHISCEDEISQDDAVQKIKKVHEPLEN